MNLFKYSRRPNVSLFRFGIHSQLMSTESGFLSGHHHKIAILIDGDNAESGLIAEYVAETGRFGKVTVKRIYADWTSPAMKGWKNQLNAYAIKPIQKFAYTKAKSSTDTALIIDAMDLLHSKLVDGFCIVSSDSDYTGLAHRIREEGMFIMGIGRSHTPEAFVRACESFTYAEILSSSNPKENDELYKYANRTVDDDDLYQGKTMSTIDIGQIKQAFQIAVEIDTGLAYLSRVAETLRVLDPSFDSRKYGYSSFRKFSNALQPHFEIVTGQDGVTLFLRENPSAVVVKDDDSEHNENLHKLNGDDDNSPACDNSNEENENFTDKQEKEFISNNTNEVEEEDEDEDEEDSITTDNKINKENLMLNLRKAYQMVADMDTGLAPLSRLSETLRSKDPSFDPRKFGFSSFRKFCDSFQPLYEVVTGNDGVTLYLREK
eukprot:gene1794-3483_t